MKKNIFLLSSKRYNLKKEAIILAGGLGTRLSDAVPGLPKCMAPVNGIPFISLLIRYLKAEGITHFIFSLGYRHELVEEYISSHYPLMPYTYAVESSPLGTGGAIQKSLQLASTDDVFVVNGDTFFDVRLTVLMNLHRKLKAACTVALKPMVHFSRYGMVELGSDHLINGFFEKKQYDKGLINGGIYIVNRSAFLQEKFPEVFSFEKDYLEQFLGKHKIAGQIQDEYFIDIGIPEDYYRAQQELNLFLQ